VLNIYITRHGETLWNRENRLQGWKDSELTEKGINNAIALRKRLEHTELNAIYSSPIGRTVKTAKLICSDRIIPVLLEDDIKEINFGEWEGKVQQEIEANSRQEFYDFWKAPHLYNHLPHKGESLKSLKERVERAVTKIITENNDGNVLIVTHGVAIRALLSCFMNIPFEKWWEGPFIEGASLTLVQYDGQDFHVEMIGDTSHME
jgi:probable phosphoglycerate mutase